MSEKYSILIAEDEKTTAKYFGKILESAGYLVEIANDGKEAYDKLKTKTYDALITDWMMPKIDGINLIRNVRKEINPAPLILMITTLGSSMSKNHALNSGADDFLMKPINPDDLINILNNTFKRSQQVVGEIPDNLITTSTTKLPPFVAVVIATSTGGPSTILELFKKLKFTNKAAYYVVQHGPAWMFDSYAKRIEEVTASKTLICKNDMPSEAGNIYIAPGDYHIMIDPDTYNIKLSNGPRENFVRPAADPLFRTAADAFGRFCIGVVLTGLGADGAKGCVAIHSAQGKILVQDPETAIAPSMPNAVISTKVIHTVVKLDDLHNSISSNVFTLHASLLKQKGLM